VPLSGKRGKSKFLLWKKRKYYLLSQNSIVVSTNPWMIILFAMRPSIMIGTNIDNKNYCKFISQYKISYLLTSDANLEKTLDREARLVLKDQAFLLFKTSVCK
jgi:hypothetical protein